MRRDLIVMRGDSREFTVTITDAAGDPYDLTDADITFTVGQLVTKVVGDGITVSDPETGVVTITLEPDDTTRSPGQRTAFSYDVEVSFPNGIVKTPVRGLFIVIPDVTTH